MAVAVAFATGGETVVRLAPDGAVDIQAVGCENVVVDGAPLSSR